MGRSTTSLKSKEPIAIPHDGPIFHSLEDSSTRSQPSIAHPSLFKALQLCEETEATSAASQLYQELRQAATSKDQIQRLQAYKNNKRNPISSKAEEQKDEDKTGLNRILLEWSLSIRTPVPVRRAVQSILSSEEQSMTMLSRTVLESLLISKSWVDPLISLETAVNSPMLKPLLQGALLHDCLTFLYDEFVSKFIGSSTDHASSNAAVGIRIAEIIKLLLDNQDADDELPCRSEFQQFMLVLFVCPAVPTDGFNTLGIVYGRLLLCSGSKSIADTVIHEVDSIDDTLSELSALARLQIVKGIAATLTSEVLMDTTTTISNQSPLECCWRYLLNLSKVATDPMVRWGALKGMSTLASRLDPQKGQSKEYGILIQDTLDVVMQAWENPPMRKLGAAIPGLFKSLIELIQDDNDLQNLISSILQQPVNRKGRYLALDMLLPYMSAGQTLEVEPLLEGIGDRGANTGPIGDLWKKLLLHLWDQISESSSTTEEALIAWKAKWIPSLSRALVLQTLSRRRQVAAFCLPRVADMMKKSKSLQMHLSSVLVDIFAEIGRLNHKGKRVVIDFSETVQDRLLWAHLELARHCALQKAMTTEVQSAIAMHLSKATIHQALTHGISSIRLLAFQAIHVVVAAYGDTIKAETDLWRYAFSFVAKSTESKEYTSAMLHSLTAFMDRLSLSQETSADGDGEFRLFCVDFLLGEVVIKRGAYAGTIADKEGFDLSLLGYILSFVTQDQLFSIDSTVAKHGVIFNRKRSPAEKRTMFEILSALYQREIFGSLFSLLFSIWDNTRAVTSRFLHKLVVAGQLHKLSLPCEFSSTEARASLKARGIYLASSPRQREADTGARILAFLYISLDGANDRLDYLKDLMELLKTRLYSMRDQLRGILNGEDDSTRRNAGILPLAHGFIQAIALSVEHKTLDKQHGTSHAGTKHDKLFDELLEVMSEAMQVSLAVVADVKEGELAEGMSEEMDLGNNTTDRSSVPLNVNTGAIGANGTFSSVSPTDKDELMDRLAVQRVVIGSWLLTKEACSAISALFTIEGYRPPYDAFVKVGALLISTLTTLKHAGAAFAARDSLQVVVAVCFAAKDAVDLHGLPSKWTKRLVDEISMSDKVRDSTLRRSTGYALGFLAIMRSEIAAKQGPTHLCSSILDELITFSLPPKIQLRNAMEQIGMGDFQNTKASLFVLSSGQKRSLVRDAGYEARCRVHALNVIRLIILDSPLKSVVTPIVGDAIIAAILGYNDMSWAVRNSATMVLSAAMLRVIDADKNASNSDRTSSNAITITELFRRYPSLSSFLPSVMKSCLEDLYGAGAASSQIFPILLLLSRIQPIANSGERAATLAESFIPILLDCINSRHHGIRAAGARALANLCSDPSILSEQCSTLLRGNLSRLVKDWNMVDGILLSFEALALAFPLSSSESDLIKSSLWTIIVPDTSVLPPPTCISAAMRTFSTFLRNEKCATSTWSSSVLGACKRVIVRGGLDGLVGGSELLATAATLFSHFLQEDVWNPKNQAVFQNALEETIGLFTSGIFDVRLAAAKAFKKGIYHHIDALLGCHDKRQGTDVPTPGLIISSVARMLLQTLHVELSRKEPFGSHPPTVRRLSRCFLECFYGHTTLINEKDDHSIPVFLATIEIDLLWSSAMRIVQKDSALGDVTDDCNGETFSSSNAVEMMAIVIASIRGSMDTVAFCDSLREFVDVVKRLNDQQASWRSRHSAALAIEKSALLNSSQFDFEGGVGLLDEVVRELLGMLQDSDPDVRAAAARAARQMESSSTLSVSQLPELILQETYLKAYDISRRHETSSTIHQLDKSLLASCEGIVEVMLTFEEESMKSSGKLLSDAGLLNTTSSRKIFEKEDPNPNNEKMLSNQLAIRSLVEVGNYPESDSSARETLFATCFKCLEVLSRNTNTGGMAHEITRFPFVFPPLHGIILSVAAAIYLGANDSLHNHKELAQAIVDKVKGHPEPSIHPAVLSCVETLANAEPSSPQTKEAILKSCFLL